MFKIITK